MINLIRQELEALSDEKYAEFNKKLCPDTNKKILGVSLPKLRKIAQKIVKENYWKEFLKQVDENSFEETMLQGFVIAYSKINIEEKLEYIKEFVPKMDSWALTDSFCNTLKLKQDDLEIVWNFILPYLDSDKEFEIRFAIITMLCYYINDKYVDLIIKKLDKVSHDGYYVKMAVAWCLAEIGVKYNEKFMDYMKKDSNLDKFTYNKTLQKMRESYRIDKKQKEILKAMKKI